MEDYVEGLPGTIERFLDRFVGDSSILRWSERTHPSRTTA